MRNNRCAYIILLLIGNVCLSQNLFAQETLQPLVSQQKTQLKSQTQAESLLKNLPFFDDFAYPDTRPSALMWQDDDAYVNRGFAKNVKTIGVVSLDAMASNGKLHENVATTARISDYLTSLPINLKNYELMYVSDKLYRKNGSSFVLLDDSYFLYDAKLSDYVSVTQGLAYCAGDTIYKKVDDLFVAQQDSIFDKDKQYIIGSYKTEHQWFDYHIEDSLALSFYYQAGGNVDVPEATDSLVLEFYIPYDTSGVLINEINTTGVEIYNATDSLISLKGWFLLPLPLVDVMENDSLGRFSLPEFEIPAYRHCVIPYLYFSTDSLTVPLAYLYSPDTVLVDSISLSEKLGTGFGYARMPDGNPTWAYTATETMGECNPSWKWIWSTSKKTGDEFVPVYIPLEQASNLVKGFRFRFKNYTSLSNDASHARNEDFWHIDLIWLNANRSVTNLDVPDVAFTSEITPLYSRYKALPMSHFAQVDESDFKMTVLAKFINFDTDFRKVKFNFTVKKLHTGEALFFPTYETDIPAATAASERDILTEFDVDFFSFLSEDIDVYDDAEYEFSYFFTDIANPLYEQYRWNDTCRSVLTVSNYYAYDDGTPEAGYGLRDAPMGKVAFKFDILQSDTLKAISTYFNPTMREQATTFNLCVWENNNGLPGELLYYAPSERIAYADGMFQFVDYEIHPENIVNGGDALVVGKSFFVGWEQPNDVLLNMGIDLNQSLNNRLYYNLGFEWENSVQKGALLLRPIFGNYTKTALPTVASEEVSVFPSIAKNLVKISSSNGVKQVLVTDMTGNVVVKTVDSEFSVACLPNGCYVVMIQMDSDTIVIKKLIVAK